MALTSSTTFDIVGQTQAITFNNPSQVDQITFSSNQITFSASTTFNLAKSDLILYFKYLNAFNNLLLINFPSISSSVGQIFPLCSFQLSETFAGVEHITYDQTTAGNMVLHINYVPVAVSGAFSTRSAPVTITIQEFFLLVLLMNGFTNQVSLN
jgi:hypothetical protein